MDTTIVPFVKAIDYANHDSTVTARTPSASISSDITDSTEDLSNLLDDLHNLNLTSNVKMGACKASGASADVYDGHLGVEGKVERQKVAIKKFRIHSNVNNDFAKAIARELRVWASLEHRNVLPLLGFICENSWPSLVSAWMENGTLRQYMEKSRDWDIGFMATGISEGLAYLHDRGVIHSDLKSINVLIDSDGGPILCDFGVSRLRIDSRTVAAPTAMAGSTRWMAIELVSPDSDYYSGRAIHQWHTKETDVWAFGMVIYELLSGELPFYQIPLDPQVIRAIAEGESPAKPTEDAYNKNILDYFWRVCVKCWRKNPKERPSMSDLVDEIKAIARPAHRRFQVDKQIVAHEDVISAISFSPDGRWLATGSWDNTICVWDTQSGSRRYAALSGHRNAVTCIAWSPSGDSVVSGSLDRTLRKWNSLSRFCLFTCTTSASICAVAFSRNGDQFVSCNRSNTITVHAASDGEEMTAIKMLLDESDMPTAIAYALYGDRVVVGTTQGAIVVVNACTGQTLFGPSDAHRLPPVTSISFHAKGLRFAVATSHDVDKSAVYVWNELGPRSTHRKLVDGTMALAVQYSQTGEYVLTASNLGQMCVWDAMSGRMYSASQVSHRDVTDPPAAVLRAAFAPNEQLAASGDCDGNIVFWRIEYV